MGFFGSLFRRKPAGTATFKKTKLSKNYPSRLASHWSADGKSELQPQLWLRFKKAWMAETVASLRPGLIEQYLAGAPEVVADSDGTGVLIFPLRDGSQIVPVIRALVPVLSGEGCGNKKPKLAGGAAVNLPPSQKKDLMYFVGGGQAIKMGRVISW